METGQRPIKGPRLISHAHTHGFAAILLYARLR